MMEQSKGYKMKSLVKKVEPPIFWMLMLVFICLGGIVIWWILPVLINSPRERMQMELSKELGVEIQDYPYPSSFPSGYFRSVLKPGMSISEVHEIVQGYEKVVHCSNTREIYYYFSAELRDAKRFQLSYDEGKYSRFQGEEDDSRTLHSDGCVSGLIQE